MALSIARKDFGDVTVLELDGHLTLGESTRLFMESVQDLLRVGRRRFIVDYSNISYVDSMGNQAIVRAYVTARNAGGDVVIVGLKGRAADAFALTRLNKVFEVFPTISDALGHFGVGEKDGCK